MAYDRAQFSRIPGLKKPPQIYGQSMDICNSFFTCQFKISILACPEIQMENLKIDHCYSRSILGVKKAQDSYIRKCKIESNLILKVTLGEQSIAITEVSRLHLQCGTPKPPHINMS